MAKRNDRGRAGPAVAGGRRAPLSLLVVIAVGGAAGACLRRGASLLWPTPAEAFPWTTLGVNLAGCAAIGVLMAVISVRHGVQRHGVHPLVRPFLGVGVLGGFTTFSAYAVEARGLVTAGRAGFALAYLGGTVLGALVAVSAATAVTRQLGEIRQAVREEAG
ncbi:fluoride efflux transporter FluC [Parafrankia elaeagni]|uniref:fluoride efflux transporter FluC n=1 Tax=Parafrankia elaeagni TaxID=222534 RepID=UPI001E2CDF92|nr:CrcB family protein [Parafrankia elaeagni]